MTGLKTRQFLLGEHYLVRRPNRWSKTPEESSALVMQIPKTIYLSSGKYIVKGPRDWSKNMIISFRRTLPSKETK